jgi:hypothetical protein
MGHWFRRTRHFCRPIDTGIRLDSNTCPGGPGEVPYGEVKVAESEVAAHDSGRIVLGGGDAGS